MVQLYGLAKKLKKRGVKFHGEKMIDFLRGIVALFVFCILFTFIDAHAGILFYVILPAAAIITLVRFIQRLN